jgi:hypothetical protein
MTTVEYDRTVEKLNHLRQIGMSVRDYLDQLSLFEPELSAEQMELLVRLDDKKSRKSCEAAQPSLF